MCVRRDFDAVFLATGLGARNALGLANENATGVEDAIDFIERLWQVQNKGSLPVGERVIVICGGMTAIDIGAQVKKLGARELRSPTGAGQPT